MKVDATRSGQISVSRSALIHNINVLRHKLRERSESAIELIPVIKANGYGAGIESICEVLKNDFNTEHATVAVATLGEAKQVSNLLPEVSVLILACADFVTQGLEQGFDLHKTGTCETWSDRWIVLLSSQAELGVLDELHQQSGRSISFHLALDTGMSREGASPNLVQGLLNEALKRDWLQFEGVMTQLAASDENQARLPVEKQLRRFLLGLKNVRQVTSKPLKAHVSNSAHLLRKEHSSRWIEEVQKMNCRVAVRPGLSLLGACVSDGQARLGYDLGLKDVVTWTAPLVGLKEIQRGDSVSYGASWTAKRDSWIGIVRVGYADGYARQASNKGVFALDGVRVPIVGRVCMDITCVDLTDYMAKKGLPALGDAVVVLAGDLVLGPRLDELAQFTRRIPYEVLTSISPLIQRHLKD